MQKRTKHSRYTEILASCRNRDDAVTVVEVLTLGDAISQLAADAQRDGRRFTIAQNDLPRIINQALPRDCPKGELPRVRDLRPGFGLDFAQESGPPLDPVVAYYFRRFVSFYDAVREWSRQRPPIEWSEPRAIEERVSPDTPDLSHRQFLRETEEIPFREDAAGEILKGLGEERDDHVAALVAIRSWCDRARRLETAPVDLSDYEVFGDNRFDDPDFIDFASDTHGPRVRVAAELMQVLTPLLHAYRDPRFFFETIAPKLDEQSFCEREPRLYELEWGDPLNPDGIGEGSEIKISFGEPSPSSPVDDPGWVLFRVLGRMLENRTPAWKFGDRGRHVALVLRTWGFGALLNPYLRRLFDELPSYELPLVLAAAEGRSHYKDGPRQGSQRGLPKRRRVDNRKTKEEVFSLADQIEEATAEPRGAVRRAVGIIARKERVGREAIRKRMLRSHRNK